MNTDPIVDSVREKLRSRGEDQNEDFSLKWFGIPDKKIVAFWKELEKRPIRRVTPHNPKDNECICHQCLCRRIAILAPIRQT